MKCCAPGLILKMREKATQTWLIKKTLHLCRCGGLSAGLPTKRVRSKLWFHCDVFLGKILYSHSSCLQPRALLGTGKLMLERGEGGGGGRVG